MGSRSAEDVKQDIESERERLGNAVQALRSQAGTVRRRLPLIALVAGGSGLVLRAVAKRVFSRGEQERDSRGRFPFLNRH